MRLLYPFTYFFIYLFFLEGGGGGGGAGRVRGGGGGGGVQFFFFVPSGPQFGSKIRGEGVAGPYPGSATARSLGQQFGS